MFSGKDAIKIISENEKFVKDKNKERKNTNLHLIYTELENLLREEVKQTLFLSDNIKFIIKRTTLQPHLRISDEDRLNLCKLFLDNQWLCTYIKLETFEKDFTNPYSRFQQDVTIKVSLFTQEILKTSFVR